MMYSADCYLCYDTALSQAEAGSNRFKLKGKIKRTGCLASNGGVTSSPVTWLLSICRVSELRADSRFRWLVRDSQNRLRRSWFTVGLD